MPKKDNRQKILDTCLYIAGVHGCRFTIDDIQNELQISRRTIYRYFSSKEEILIALIEQVGEEVHTRQREIYDDPTLSTVEKLQEILTVKTREEDLISPEKLYEYEKYYPHVYDYFMKGYEREWFLVEKIIQQGIDEGVFREYSVELIKLMIQNGMQILCKGDFLDRNDIKYHTALRQMVNIVLQGILSDEK